MKILSFGIYDLAVDIIALTFLAVTVIGALVLVL